MSGTENDACRHMKAFKAQIEAREREAQQRKWAWLRTISEVRPAMAAGAITPAEGLARARELMLAELRDLGVTAGRP